MDIRSIQENMAPFFLGSSFPVPGGDAQPSFHVGTRTPHPPKSHPCIVPRHKRRSSNLRGRTMRENTFQAKLIKKLEKLFPGCVILKNDAGYLQGFPDLTIFYKNRWAVLECKKNASAEHQPNQDYYVEMLNGMSFGRFIFPENEEEVLRDLQQAFGVRRKACPSVSEQTQLAE